jgi:serine/threonine protein kinase
MHCDLNPRNILIKETDQNKISPVVADFGISIVMGNSTKQGTQILGYCERWMPCEYLQDDTVSRKTDVWSLGCLIFYLFSGGQLPWTKCKNGPEASRRILNNSDFF